MSNFLPSGPSPMPMPVQMQAPQFYPQSQPVQSMQPMQSEGIRISLPPKPFLANMGGLVAGICLLFSLIFGIVYLAKLPNPKSSSSIDKQKKTGQGEEGEENEQEEEEEEGEEKGVQKQNQKSNAMQQQEAQKYLYICFFFLIVALISWIVGKFQNNSWKNQTQKTILESGYPPHVIDMLLRNQNSQQMNESIQSVGKSLSTGLIASAFFR